MSDKKSLIIFIAFVVIILVLLFVGADTRPSVQSGVPTRPPIAPGPEIVSSADVSIKDLKFVPANLSVKKGTLVTWQNNDQVAHSVRSGKDFSSRLISPGSLYSHGFNTVGVFKYNCDFHPAMTGTITITE